MTTSHRVDARGPAGRVPGLVFVPEVATGDAPLPLVLLGHGGGGSKDEARFQRLATKLAEGIGAGVLVIDGPVHGERLPTEGDAATRFRTARRALSDPAVFDQMLEDWRAASAAAADVAPTQPEPLGYIGFSMGTVFGIPTVAGIPSIRGAVFGLGGFFRTGGVAAIAELASANPAAIRIIEEEDRPEVRNELVRRAALALRDTEVLMLSMSRDESFPLEGALELFHLFSTPKRLALWEGGHLELPEEAIDLAISFLRRTMAVHS